MAASDTMGTVAGTMGFPIVLTLNYPLKGVGEKKAQSTSILF